MLRVATGVWGGGAHGLPGRSCGRKALTLIVGAKSEDELGNGADTKFAVDGFPVIMSGASGDAELLADLLIRQAL